MKDGNCRFYRQHDHYINTCKEIDMAIHNGKCCKNTKNHIVLPTGVYLPQDISGNCLLDRIEE
ncbi:uncharacterized protein BT62DRAFT_889906 [Guyanagaster necrorhizus]|uniref:Uncharacterized protein n=1 Tax=Guyanagaster necrorhizus TaxID=856835 RepID=A0A9P8AUD7_9AGAR|nr:uncharacterized protein BT62DRAFT_889906 [Guyanagaster necrorhizus MCA 3950]KAG7448368.1 hypothetical protein BT62DRAFT_889906 [Guyanagaster necrorhizus MCA 3950]